MSLQEVQQRAEERDQAVTRLLDACKRAVEAGVPQAAVARAAGVSRNTIRAWLER